jgi:hypothetical protein
VCSTPSQVRPSAPRRSVMADACRLSPPVFLTPNGLEHVGPRAFGYDIDFRSVFDEGAWR